MTDSHEAQAPTPRRLNIGCGHEALEGWVNLDLQALPGVNVVHDLNDLPLPFAADAFDEISCIHVLEHVDSLILTLAELHRILAPGGRLRVKSPHFTSHTTYVDPTHQRSFSLATFDFFVQGSMFHDMRDYYFDFVFSSYEHRRLGFGRTRSEPWNRLVENLINKGGPSRVDLYERTALARLFPAQEIDVVLIK